MYYNLLELVLDKDTKTFKIHFTEHYLQGPLLSDPALPRGLYSFAYCYYEKSDTKENAIKILLDSYTKYVTSSISDLESCLNEFKDVLPEFRAFVQSESSIE